MRTGIHNPSAFRCLQRAGVRVYGLGHRSLPRNPFRGRIFMKQSAAKTLGVAALGAAFAAAGAGAANAASALPNAAPALDTVTKSLPAESVADKALPGTGQAVAQSRPAVATGSTAAQPVAEQV